MDATTRREIPRLPAHWLLGNLPEFRRAPQDFIAHGCPPGHGLWMFRVFHKKMLVISDPDCAEHIFKTNGGNYRRGHQFKNLSAILGTGLVCMEGEVWKRHRKFVAPAFKPDFLKYSLTQNVRLIHKMLESWDQASAEGRCIDGAEEMRRFTLTVIVHALFSVDIDLEKHQALYQALVDANDLVFRRHTSLINFPAWVPTPLNRAIAGCRRDIDEFISEQLRQKRANPDSGSEDIVDYLLAANKDGELSEAEVYDEICTLFVAGFETTATALAWTLYLLARNPEAVAKWQVELDEVLADRPPTWDDIPRLKFTENIFRESMRLYPSIYGLSRVSLQDDLVNGYAMPGGQAMILSIYGIQRSPEYWDEPEAFKPERFEGKWPQRAYLPFGIGKHVCIGARFATIEAMLILACIGQRFHLQLDIDEEIAPEARVSLLPSRPIKLRLERR